MNYLFYWFQDLALTLLTFNFFVRKRKIREFVGNRSFKKVLDAGCGTGILSSLFSPDQYYGIDLDKNSIAYAKEKYPGYKFEVGNITKINTPKNFDLVLIVGVLHHLSDRDVDKFFSSLSSLLLRNAEIIIIEAIPPILKFNIIGHLLRWFDKGKFARRQHQYKNLIDKNYQIIREEVSTELFFDYAIFLAGK